MVAGTLRTDSFHKIIAGPGVITFWKDHRRNMDIVKTESTVTSFAIEMDMGIFVMIGIVAQTQFITGPFHVFNGMDKMMILEGVQAAENTGLVNSLDPVLQFHQAQRALLVLERLGHQQTVGGNLDSMFFQVLLYLRL